MSYIENTVYGFTYMTSQNIRTKHAFTTRYGGVSSGIFKSMNLGLNTDDDPLCIVSNYAIVRNALSLPSGRFVCSNQIHGNNIRIAKYEDCAEPPLLGNDDADILITNQRDIALVIFTADCVPILLFDPYNEVISAVHSGWRGTALDVVSTAINAMQTEFGCKSDNIKAAIGPSISGCCYETDTDVVHSISDNLPVEQNDFYTKRGDKYMVDLKRAVYIQLTRAGITEISVSDECTFCSSEKYWSHRKTKGIRGSQAAIIVLS